jgi:hypothetical protein
MAGPNAAQLERQFQKVRKSRPGVGRITENLNRRFGVRGIEKQKAGIRKAILNTEDILKRVPEDVVSRSRELGGPVTESTKRRIQSARQAPIIDQLKGLSGSEEQARIGLEDARGRVAQLLQSKILQRQDVDADFRRRIANALAREEAAKGFERQKELTRLSASLRGGGGGAGGIGELDIFGILEEEERLRQEALDALDKDLAIETIPRSAVEERIGQTTTAAQSALDRVRRLFR